MARTGVWPENVRKSRPQLSLTVRTEAPSHGATGRRWRSREDVSAARLLAHDTIPVAVAYERVCWMRTRDRGNSVPARLGAGDSPVSIVVIKRECIVAARR